MGITRHVLAERLKRLVEEGILEKQSYIDRQQRFEYVLTAKGRDLKPILMAIVEWGVQWTDAEEPKILFEKGNIGRIKIDSEPELKSLLCKQAFLITGFIWQLFSLNRSNSCIYTFNGVCCFLIRARASTSTSSAVA